MKQYGNYSTEEVENMYPFEFDINYYLLIAHRKKLNGDD